MMETRADWIGKGVLLPHTVSMIGVREEEAIEEWPSPSNLLPFLLLWLFLFFRFFSFSRQLLPLPPL